MHLNFSKFLNFCKYRFRKKFNASTVLLIWWKTFKRDRKSCYKNISKNVSLIFQNFKIVKKLLKFIPILKNEEIHLKKGYVNKLFIGKFLDKCIQITDESKFLPHSLFNYALYKISNNIAPLKKVDPKIAAISLQFGQYFTSP